MLVNDRRARVLDEVTRRGSVTVAELASLLGVSGMTVRRDLDVLARQGVLDKVHGGATAPRSSTGLGTYDPSGPGPRHDSGLRRDPGPHRDPGPRRDPAAATRQAAQDAAEADVAELVATLVEPGMAVGLSSGSATLAVARALVGVPDLTVVTNSLRIADLLQRVSAADDSAAQSVVLTGGVRTPADALVGPVAVRSLGHLHCDVVMIGVHGIDQHAGFTTKNLLEAETNRAFISAGSSVTVVADHTRWGRVGLTTVVDLDAVDRVVVDDGLEDEHAEVLRPLVNELWIASSAAPAHT